VAKVALTNRDRVGKMFDILSPELDGFIDRVVGPEIEPGTDWTVLVAVKDGQKGVKGKTYSRTDPLVQLRMLSENITGQVKKGWHPFNAHLTRSQESFASELRDTRNKWAHGDSFSQDDAYRALDTAERLLRAVDAAADAADEVGRLRLELRRVTADADDRRVNRSTAVQSDSAGLAPWRDVLPPHEDVATGNFRAAEFAADLYKVSTGDVNLGRDYTDPSEFFARTFLTEGLRDLVERALQRLSGDDNASPVINLQTNFGGGKTHSMLALWHLAAGAPLASFPQEAQDLLSGAGYRQLAETGTTVRRVALVGNHVAPSGSTKDDGTVVNTLWGEMAWQLGGADAYAIVAESDRTSTAPGEALHELLRTHAPAVILIDEWVAYARQLYDREDIAAGTFDTQFTFAQSLTEAAKATSGILVAISIPASDDRTQDGDVAAGSAEEVGGAYGQEALRRLQNVVRRVADQWRPASPEESYHIVRRRLFVEPDATALAAISATARAFGEFYRKHSDAFPRDVRQTDYEERIRRSYPIHPQLFDQLYEDWSTLERFQRTRGVLRLMNTVIHELWTSGDASPLIMPGSVPLSSAAVNTELTQYLSDSWKPIVDADVDGPHSVPAAIDTEKPALGARSLTRRLARTVFFGAAPTINTAHKGLELERVFVGTAVPGDVPGNFHTALNALGDRATYFYSAANKYWYDTQANITRRAKDQAERLSDADVWLEIVDRLKAHQSVRGGFAAVYAGPEDSADIPDVDEARLVLVHPRYGHSRKMGAESPAAQFAHAATERRGSANRTYRNMVVFLAGDVDRLGELSSAVRDFLGWKHVADSVNDLNLTVQQIAQANDRRNRADQTATDRLVGAYHWALVPEAKEADAPFTVAMVKAEASAPSLGERVSRKLVNDSMLTTEHAAALIGMDLRTRIPSVWEAGHVAVGDLWRCYAMYPYMPRLRDHAVLDAGIRSVAGLWAWNHEGFATAESYDSASGTYTGLVLPSDERTASVHDGLLLVRPDRAQAQRDRQLAAQPAGDTDAEGVVTDSGSTVPTQPGAPTPVAPTPVGPAPKTRFFGVRSLSAERYAADFKKVTDEVIQHLAAVPGVQLTVRLEIEAVAPDGFADDKIRTVGENATTLKFDQSGFEEA
jgi:predicted AAA+ superfamily ATPase